MPKTRILRYATGVSLIGAAYFIGYSSGRKGFIASNPSDSPQFKSQLERRSDTQKSGPIDSDTDKFASLRARVTKSGPDELIRLISEYSGKIDLDSKSAELLILKKLASISPSHAIEYVNNNYQGDKKHHALGWIYKGMLTDNPREAVNAITSIADAETRIAVTSGILMAEAITPALFNTLVDTLEPSGLLKLSLANQKSAEILFKQRPDLFETALNALPMTSTGAEDGRKMLLSASSVDPEKTAKLLLARPDIFADDEEILARIGSQILLKGGTKALAKLLKENPNNGIQISKMIGAASATQWLSGGASDLSAGLKGIQHSSFASGVYTTTGSMESLSTLSGTLGKFLSDDLKKENSLFSFLEPTERQNYANQALKSMVTQDPAAALNLLSTLNSKNLGVIGYDGLVSGWMSQDPVAASSWVQSLPPGEARISSIKALLPFVEKADPVVYESWKKEIESQ